MDNFLVNRFLPLTSFPCSQKTKSFLILVMREFAHLVCNLQGNSADSSNNGTQHHTQSPPSPQPSTPLWVCTSAAGVYFVKTFKEFSLCQSNTDMSINVYNSKIFPSLTFCLLFIPVWGPGACDGHHSQLTTWQWDTGQGRDLGLHNSNLSLFIQTPAAGGWLLN